MHYMKIVLASASPRRQELLRKVGLSFEVIPADIVEHVTTSDPSRAVQELSSQKAEAVYRGISSGGSGLLVIGADTVVADGGRILGKPKSEEEAVQMLRALSGHMHQVYTGVTLLLAAEGRVRQQNTFCECTEVDVCAMTDREIREYVATGDPMDKAGAYGIQGIFARYVRGIRGDYNNVVGLPVSALYHALTDMGIFDK